MFKSKHSGWTWDLKRTPFGGGGWNPISAITDPISEAIGTSGSGGGLLGALADIDPGPAIGEGLASVDKAVNEIPGGWYTVGGLAAGGTALAFAPEIAAAAGIGEGTTITSAAGQQAFFDALANGATSTQAINAGIAADALAAGAGTGAGVADVITQTPGANSILAAPDVTVPSLAPSTGGTFGSIAAPLEGSGAIPGAGATTLGGGGLTGALPSGVIVGDGTLGTTMGATMATDAGTLATDMFGNPISASSTGIGGFAPTEGLSAYDIANNAKRLQTIGKLLGATNPQSISGRAAPTAQQWATQAAQNYAQATPQQFGGLYEMNKNPFTFQNPLAAALKNKDVSGFDVSGTGGQALNTQNQASNLAKLLA